MRIIISEERLAEMEREVNEDLRRARISRKLSKKSDSRIAATGRVHEALAAVTAMERVQRLEDGSSGNGGLSSLKRKKAEARIVGVTKSQPPKRRQHTRAQIRLAGTGKPRSSGKGNQKKSKAERKEARRNGKK